MLPVLGILRQILAGWYSFGGADLGFRVLIGAGALVGLFVRGRRADTALAVVMITDIVAYFLVVLPFVTVVTAQSSVAGHIPSQIVPREMRIYAGHGFACPLARDIAVCLHLAGRGSRGGGSETTSPKQHVHEDFGM